MIHGIGIDTVCLDRFNQIYSRWGEKLERKVLNETEREELPKNKTRRQKRLALAFAAKEAFAKAIGSGLRWPVTFQQISIKRDKLGAPHFVLGQELKNKFKDLGLESAHISLSDDEKNAIAMAVIEKTNEK